MACRGKPIPGETIRMIVGLRALRYSLRCIARHAGVSLSTVQKYLDLRRRSSVQLPRSPRVGLSQ
jgi:hypothetical protein